MPCTWLTMPSQCTPHLRREGLLPFQIQRVPNGMGPVYAASSGMPLSMDEWGVVVVRRGQSRYFPRCAVGH